MISLPNFTNTFILECNALGKGIEIVLMQEGQPLDFTNKQLCDKHLVKSTFEKEMMDILHVVDIWHPYLLSNVSKIE